MAIYRVQAPDGHTYRIEGPEGASDEQVIAAILQQYPAARQAPKPSTERTWTEAATDIGAGLVSGAGSLAQLPGQLYGLATGDMDNVSTRAGEAIKRQAEGMKSAGLKGREELRRQAIAAAEERGQVAAAATAFGQTIKDPGLLLNFVAEQLPNLLPGLAAARGMSLATRGAASLGAKTAAAMGAGAVQQGADVGAGTYDRLVKELVAQGATEQEAAEGAINLARASGASAAVISVIANKYLPGGQAIERVLAGGKTGLGAVTGAVTGALKEIPSEVTEEVGGQLGANIAMRQIKPEQQLTESLGETAGMAAVGAVGLGGVTGAVGGRGAPQETAAEEDPRLAEWQRQRQQAQQAQQEAPAELDLDAEYGALVQAREQLRQAEQTPEVKEQLKQVTETLRKRDAEMVAAQQVQQAQTQRGEELAAQSAFAAQEPQQMEFGGMGEPMVLPDAVRAAGADVEGWTKTDAGQAFVRQVMSLPKAEVEAVRESLPKQGMVARLQRKTFDALYPPAAAVTPQDLEAAGQQRLPLRRTPAGQPTTSALEELEAFGPAVAPPAADADIPEPTIRRKPELILPPEVNEETVGKSTLNWIKTKAGQDFLRGIVGLDPAEARAQRGEFVGKRQLVRGEIFDAIYPEPAAGSDVRPEPEAGRGAAEPSVGVPVSGGPDVAGPEGAQAPDGTGMGAGEQPAVAEPALEGAAAPAVTPTPSPFALDQLLRGAPTAEPTLEAEPEVETAPEPEPAPAPRRPSAFDIPKRSLFDPIREAQQKRDEVGGVIYKGDAYGVQAGEVTQPYAADELRAEVSDFVRAPVPERKLKVVDSVEDLLGSKDENEVKVGQALQREGAFGVATNGRAYLVANRIQKGQGRAKFMHEVGAHLGLEGLLPSSLYKRLTNQLKQWAESGANTDEAMLAAQALQRVQAAQTPEADRDAELLAYFVEEAVQAGVNPTATQGNSPLQQWFRALWAAFKGALRKLGMKPETMTAQDVVNLAFGAARLELAGTFHGTAAQFRKFDHRFMGTGEGAQAFGWGTYLAQRAGIAKGYWKADVARKMKPSTTMTVDGVTVNVNMAPADVATAILGAPSPDTLGRRTGLQIAFHQAKQADFEMSPQEIEDRVNSAGGLVAAIPGAREALSEYLPKFVEAKMEAMGPEGSFMRVDTAVADNDLLDWDRPLGEQDSVALKLAMYLPADIREEIEEEVNLSLDEMTGEDLYRAMQYMEKRSGRISETFDVEYYNANLASAGDKQVVSTYLDQQLGVPGIKFFDQPSRDAARARAELAKVQRQIAAASPDQADYLANLREIEARLQKQLAAPLTRNLVIFDDKNIFRVGSAVGADRQRMRFGKASNPIDNITRTSELLKAEPNFPQRAYQAAMQVVQDRRGLTPVDRFRVFVTDNMAGVAKVLDSAWGGKVRSSLGQINPLVALRQAQDAAKMYESLFELGGVKYDPASGTFNATQTPYAVVDIFRQMQAYADARGITLREASADISKMGEARRADSLRRSDKEVRISKLSNADPRSADEQIDEKLRQLNADPQAKAILDMMQKSREHFIDFMANTGRITAKQAAEWKKYAEYVPFDRIGEFDESFRATTSPQGLGRFANRRALVGSTTREVGNIFENHMKLVTWMATEGMKAQATRDALEVMQVLGASKKWGKNVPGNVSKSQVVYTYENGRKVFYEVNDPLYAVAFESVGAPMSWFFRALHNVSNFLRSTITLFPPFVLKQVVLDTQRAFVSAGVNNPYALPGQILKNFFQFAWADITGKRLPKVQELGAMGIAGGYDLDLSNPAESLMYEYGLRKRNPMQKVLRWADGILRASDLATRAAIYDQTVKEGGDKALAEQRAREIINFRRKGASRSVGFLIQTVPFVNAYLQSMDLLYRNAMGKDNSMGIGRNAARNRLLAQLGTVTAFSMAYALAMGGDDEYEEADLRTKFNNWLIPGVGMIPVPPEWAAITKVPAEMFMESLRNNGTPKERETAEIVGVVMRNVLEALSFGVPIPAAIKPVLENFTNFSFFTWRPLEGTYQQQLDKTLRVNANTSELAKAIAVAVDDMTGSKLQVSPIDVDNLLRGYFASTGSMLLLMADAITNPDRLDRPAHQLPLVGMFIPDKVGTRAEREFYEFAETVMPRLRTLQSLETRSPSQAEAYVERYRPELEAAETVGTVIQQLGEFNQYERYLRSDEAAKAGMSQEERKAEIDALRRVRAEYLQEFMDQTKAAYRASKSATP